MRMPRKTITESRTASEDRDSRLDIAEPVRCFRSRQLLFLFCHNRFSLIEFPVMPDVLCNHDHLPPKSIEFITSVTVRLYVTGLSCSKPHRANLSPFTAL